MKRRSGTRNGRPVKVRRTIWLSPEADKKLQDACRADRRLISAEIEYLIDRFTPQPAECHLSS